MTDKEIIKKYAARCGFEKLVCCGKWKKIQTSNTYLPSPNRKSDDVLAEEYFIWKIETKELIFDDKQLAIWLNRFIEVSKNFGWKL